MSLWRVSRTMSANYGYLDAFCRVAESGSNKKQTKIGRASPGFLAQVRGHANPNFLHAAQSDIHLCGFHKESRMECANATKLHRKFGEPGAPVKSCRSR
jgi:hypothetical protein